MAKVLVIGAGVIGLTSALELLNAGYSVTIVADHFNEAPLSYMTSEVAGALWEWPPAVCGRHTDELSLKISKGWCMTSYLKFVQLARNTPEAGVYLRNAIFFQRKNIFDDPENYCKMQELSFLPGFRHDSALIDEFQVDRSYGVEDAYCHISPTIDTTQMMQWLRKQCEDRGAKFIKRHVEGALTQKVNQLLQEYNADIIINCTGLGASETADDKDVYPLRGMLLKIPNDGSVMPKLHCPLVMALNEERMHDDQRIVFLLPRGKNDLLIGGLVEPHQTQTEGITFQHPQVQRMLKSCQHFFPPLRAYQEKDVKEIVAGLRPFRKGTIRVETDPSCRRIIHNYGHGGSGWTFSWGCASDVVKLVQQEMRLKDIQTGYQMIQSRL